MQFVLAGCLTYKSTEQSYISREAQQEEGRAGTSGGAGDRGKLCGMRRSAIMAYSSTPTSLRRRVAGSGKACQTGQGRAGWKQDALFSSRNSATWSFSSLMVLVSLSTTP